MDETSVLFRPVGQKELELIRQSEFTAFPPRLPEQPIFYPVLNEEYATQIARDWNAKHNEDRVGYVTRFRVRSEFLKRYRVQTVGAAVHQEYWIPAEELSEFNRNIVGRIEVISPGHEGDG
ncbi:MAG TPA: hypothetical protein VJU86_10580 [Pyrinomonadaceae bacterium]|nr:hypothetical protein [Pyrinomonadaceae bacterium]